VGGRVGIDDHALAAQCADAQRDRLSLLHWHRPDSLLPASASTVLITRKANCFLEFGA